MKYYVYFHKDLDTNEIVYVGKGSRGRAWHCAKSNSRSIEHANYLDVLIKTGHTPDEWVEIVESGMSSREAYKLESEIIWSLSIFPKYNHKRDNCCILTSEQQSDIKFMREQGISYTKIANSIDVSTMTVFRFVNGRNRNYGK